MSSMNGRVRRWSLKLQQNDSTLVLHRSVEVAIVFGQATPCTFTSTTMTSMNPNPPSNKMDMQVDSQCSVTLSVWVMTTIATSRPAIGDLMTGPRIRSHRHFDG